MSATMSLPEGETERLRRERDKYAAFAFCNADLLFELDPAGNIVLAVGAIGALLNQPPEALPGKPFQSLVAPCDHPIMAELMRDLASGRRVDAKVIRLAGAAGKTLPFVLGGYAVPELNNHFFLGLRSTSSALGDGACQDPEPSDLLEPENFVVAALTRMKAGRQAGESNLLSLFEMETLPELRQRLSTSERQELVRTLGSYLKVNALDGDLAGAFGESHYGLVHDSALDIGALGERMAAYTRSIDPEGKGAPVQSASTDLDPAGFSERDAARALMYTLNSLGNPGQGNLTLHDIADRLPEMLQETARLVVTTRNAITNKQFEVAYQPIVDLNTRAVKHYEALVRINDLDGSRSPTEYIKFIEESGLVIEFDLAMCEQVIVALTSMLNSNPDCHVAVNLSGRSLSSPEFQHKLLQLLEEKFFVRERLLFEITESMALTDLSGTNAFLQKLRAAGHKICLDDFGSGAAAFQYIRALDIDIVKIDGSYIQQSMADQKIYKLLKAMVDLCRELGVITVAEMIEDESQVNFLKGCGVDYGQGYLFGKPRIGVPGSETAARPGTLDLSHKLEVAT